MGDENDKVEEKVGFSNCLLMEGVEKDEDRREGESRPNDLLFVMVSIRLFIKTFSEKASFSFSIPVPDSLPVPQAVGIVPFDCIEIVIEASVDFCSFLGSLKESSHSSKSVERMVCAFSKKVVFFSLGSILFSEFS